MRHHETLPDRPPPGESEPGLAPAGASPGGPGADEAGGDADPAGRPPGWPPLRSLWATTTDPRPLTEREQASTGQIAASPRQRRLVVFDPRADATAHAGRVAMRRAVLAMSPADRGGGPLLRPVRDEPTEGVFWGQVAANGLAVVLRVRDFRTPEEARADAELLLARAEDLCAHRVVGVRGRHSLWLTLDGVVTLVAGQVWRSSAIRTADQMVLRAVRRGAPWGPLYP